MKKQKLLVTIGILGILCLWQCKSQNIVPTGLEGIWKAKRPDYKGSFLRLQEDTITFGSVEGDVQVFSIIKIKQHKREGDWESFIIHYLDNDFKRCELPIIYHPMKDGLLRIKNKEEVTWFREKT